jgi:FMN phosphatase YigB (HAD superfamily)
MVIMLPTVVALLVATRSCQSFVVVDPIMNYRVTTRQQQHAVPTTASTTRGAHVVLQQAAGSTSSTTSSSNDNNTKKKRPLVLVTFDLDDTLYPIAPVIGEANDAFVRAMKQYGYGDIQPNDIDITTKVIRSEMPPEEAAALSHTEARELAIRRRMEKVLLDRKLSETAKDWVTSVEDLSPVVVENAKQWTARAVSNQIVQAVLTAWEMERHHAAERHVYPEVQSVLQTIKEEHPGVIVGAVTDGKANPLLMTFTLAPYFDFCMSWEDDQKGRQQFFKDLAASSSSAQLTWIYNAALEKGQELATVQAAIEAAKTKSTEMEDSFSNGVWIHVGDDLAYDVGGAAACGAKTVLCELANEYRQTSRQRFDQLDQVADEQMPIWSTSTTPELEARRSMNQAAIPKVDETINFIGELPDAINRIVAAAQEEQGTPLSATVVNTGTASS